MENDDLVPSKMRSCAAAVYDKTLSDENEANRKKEKYELYNISINIVLLVFTNN